jgi:sulfur transfer protein SufE
MGDNLHLTFCAKKSLTTSLLPVPDPVSISELAIMRLLTTWRSRGIEAIEMRHHSRIPSS